MQSFQCSIASGYSIYDGDTIKDVRLEVSIPELEIGCFITRDIRISGIDTPETRPRKAGRTEESLHREREAAGAARRALVDILKANDYCFEARNVQLGKYAGRVVASVIVDGVNVAHTLLALGHAKEYYGKGPRPDWGF